LLYVIRPFELAARGCYLVYQALKRVAEEQGRGCKISIRWLKSEVNMREREVVDCINVLKRRGIISTDKRLDDLTFKFLLSSREAGEVVYEESFVERVRATSALPEVLEAGNILMKVSAKSREKDWDRAYCLRRIRKKLRTLKEQKFSREDILEHFRKLEERVARGENIERVLGGTQEKQHHHNQKKEVKVDSWGD
jgi:hypothetical protein